MSVLKTFSRIDWRLSFNNLKNETKRSNIVNSDDRNKIWIPNLIFDNSVPEALIKNDAFSSLSVKQEGYPKLQTEPYMAKITTNFVENEIFSGSDNPLVFARNYELMLGCSFELHFYPFDTQICCIVVIFIKIPIIFSNKEFLV